MWETLSINRWWQRLSISLCADSISFTVCICAWITMICITYARNNWTVVCVKRKRAGAATQNNRFHISVIFNSDQMKPSALFCLSEFFVFVLVNMWKNSHTLVASGFVTPAAQTLQHMDQVVKNKQEKEHFQVSFRPITEQRDRCCRESCTWKDTECLYSPCWFLLEFNRGVFFVFHRICEFLFGSLLMQGERRGTLYAGGLRDGEEKKKRKRKGMKVVLNMHFNGRANSFQIGREQTGVWCRTGRQPAWGSGAGRWKERQGSKEESGDR